MIFADTGPFLGRYIAKDQHHAKSMTAWADLEASRQRIVTSNFVVDEFLTLLARRTDYAFAAKKARLVYASTAVEILRPERADELKAVDLFEKLADKEVSFTDCVSFAMMRRNKIRRAFTFDGHFRDAGFDLWPGST